MMKIYFLLTGLLFAGAVRSLPSIDTDEFCSDRTDGYYCASCLQPVYCNSSEETPSLVLPSCDDYYACEQFSPTVAGCTLVDSSLTCTCSGSNTCDPYSRKYLGICLYKYIVDVEDCGESSQECHFHQCLNPPNCSEQPNGTCIHLSTYCNMGYYCDNGVSEIDVTCSRDWSYLSADCQCLVAPEPCTDFCSGDCPDLTDCHRYYVCDGLGNVVSGPLECPNDDDYYYFNAFSIPPKCDESSSQCAPLTKCGYVQG